MDQDAQMSDCADIAVGTHEPDRRVRRTRATLRSAFNLLISTRTYDAFTMGDVAEHANIGRSTLYEHYRGKDDMLDDSLAPVIEPLADSFRPQSPESTLVRTVEHFWDNRRFARALMCGRARDVVVKRLVRSLEEKLVSEFNGCNVAGSATIRLEIPAVLIATLLANAQLALIEEWLSGRHACSAAQIAAALASSSQAVVAAYMQTTP